MNFNLMLSCHYIIGSNLTQLQLTQFGALSVHLFYYNVAIGAFNTIFNIVIILTPPPFTSLNMLLTL